MKKIKMAMAAGAAIFMLSACGQTGSSEGTQSDTGSITIENIDVAEDAQETRTVALADMDSTESAGEEQSVTLKGDGPEKKDNTNSTEISEGEGLAASDEADSETTAEELLDLFINGSISAVDSTDLTSAFYLTDLNAELYSVGEKADLDNDGENELIICGPYGGIYLDARGDKVYEFAAGDGNALILSYTCYNGAIWILYSNRMNAGYESYHMVRFEGADNLVAEMYFGEKLVEPDNSESEVNYILNGTMVSYDEYAELCSKILAAEVYTN